MSAVASRLTWEKIRDMTLYYESLTSATEPAAP
jgi:hypothetical protein